MAKTKSSRKVPITKQKTKTKTKNKVMTKAKVVTRGKVTTKNKVMTKAKVKSKVKSQVITKVKKARRKVPTRTKMLSQRRRKPVKVITVRRTSEGIKNKSKTITQNLDNKDCVMMTPTGEKVKISQEYPGDLYVYQHLVKDNDRPMELFSHEELLDIYQNEYLKYC